MRRSTPLIYEHGFISKEPHGMRLFCMCIILWLLASEIYHEIIDACKGCFSVTVCAF